MDKMFNDGEGETLKYLSLGCKEIADKLNPVLEQGTSKNNEVNNISSDSLENTGNSNGKAQVRVYKDDSIQKTQAIELPPRAYENNYSNSNVVSGDVEDNSFNNQTASSFVIVLVAIIIVLVVIGILACNVFSLFEF